MAANLDLLKRLVNAYSVSGNEEEVRSIISKAMKPFVDSIDVDSMGNLVCHKNGAPPKIMLTAHMDEIGLMIHRINELGHIDVTSVGAIEAISLVGQVCHIQSKKGDIHGVITIPDLQDGWEIKELPKVHDLYVDTGLSRKELLDMGVRVGTYITLEQTFKTLGKSNIVSGKALDDRLGVFILTELARKLKGSKAEIYYVFTVQEEIGLHGAQTSAYTLRPDWAIAVDISAAEDSTKDSTTKQIGGGPCVTVMDAEVIGNRTINKWLSDTAKKHRIPVQYDVTDVGTTDAFSIQVSRGGVPVSVVGPPVRNIHSTISIASLRDVEDCIRLLYELLRNPPKVTPR
jgi:endoglucanase